MATITPVVARVKNWADAWTIVWEAVGNADTGTGVQMPHMSDRSVQMSGTWGAATLVLQGSNDNVTWVTLTDGQGNAISKTADAIEQIAEFTRYIRVSSSGGTGTDVDVTVFGRGQVN